jgi:hypothetical protein
MKLIQSHRWWLLGALLAFCSMGSSRVFGESSKLAQQTILFGAAYFEEYSPTDRLDEDVRMMKATGITVVRIAESTWGTLEPQEGASTSATSIVCSTQWTRSASRSSSALQLTPFPHGLHANILTFSPSLHAVRGSMAAARTWTLPIPTFALQPSA